MAVSWKVCGAVLFFMTFPGCFLANAQAASGESLGDVARELRLSKNGDGQSKEQSTRSPNRDKDGTSAVISESPEPQRLMDQAKSLRNPVDVGVDRYGGLSPNAEQNVGGLRTNLREFLQ